MEGGKTRTVGLPPASKHKLSGFLSKKSKTGLLMQRRFFMLDEDGMAVLYGPDKNSVEFGSPQNKRLPFSQILQVALDAANNVEIRMRAPRVGGKKHGYHSRTYVLKMQNKVDANKWVVVLRELTKPRVKPDLSSFEFLGGKIVEGTGESQERSRAVSTASSTASRSNRPVASVAVATVTGIAKPVPWKPLDQMDETEKKAWEEKLRRHEMQEQAAKLVASNLNQLQRKGYRPGDPLPPRKPKGPLDMAKNLAIGLISPKKKPLPSDPPKNETTKERVQRVAVGEGDYLTGGATAKLGKDIQNSAMAGNLAKKREEYEKMQAEKAAADKKKAEEDAAKKKNQPKKGLNDFIRENEVTSPPPPSEKGAGAAIRRSLTNGLGKLQSFLASTPSSPEPQEAVAAPASPTAAENKKLQSFIAETAAAAEPDPVGEARRVSAEFVSPRRSSAEGQPRRRSSLGNIMTSPDNEVTSPTSATGETERRASGVERVKRVSMVDIPILPPTAEKEAEESAAEPLLEKIAEPAMIPATEESTDPDPQKD